MITWAEVEDARERMIAERAAQGLPAHVTAPGALAPIAEALNGVELDAPCDDDAVAA